MKLYKMEITDYPEGALSKFTFPDGEAKYSIDEDWKPEGWDEYLTQRVGDGDRWAINNTYGRFFWPSEKRLYRSRSAAREKQAIVERWGGKAIILVAEVGEFRDVEEVAAERVRARRQAKIDKLQAQIRELRDDAGSRAAGAAYVQDERFTDPHEVTMNAAIRAAEEGGFDVLAFMGGVFEQMGMSGSAVQRGRNEA